MESLKPSLGNHSKPLDEIKSFLWNGNIELAIDKLHKLKTKIVDATEQFQINAIYIYLNNNKEQVTNYNERDKNSLVYTSQVAESTVKHLINDRHKFNQKMQ